MSDAAVGRRSHSGHRVVVVVAHAVVAVVVIVVVATGAGREKLGLPGHCQRVFACVRQWRLLRRPIGTEHCAIA